MSSLWRFTNCSWTVYEHYYVKTHINKCQVNELTHEAVCEPHSNYSTTHEAVHELAYVINHHAIGSCMESNLCCTIMCKWAFVNCSHIWINFFAKYHTYIQYNQYINNIFTSRVPQLSIPVYLTGLSNRITCQILRPSRIWYQHVWHNITEWVLDNA